MNLSFNLNCIRKFLNNENCHWILCLHWQSLIKKSSRIASSTRLQGSARVTQLQTVVGACGYIAYIQKQPAQEITDLFNPKFHEIPQPA